MPQMGITQLYSNEIVVWYGLQMDATNKMLVCEATRARGYKHFSMLNSAEHEIFLAYKCKNACLWGHQGPRL